MSSKVSKQMIIRELNHIPDEKNKEVMNLLQLYKTSSTLFQLPENLQKVISVITIFEFKIGIRNQSVLDFWNEMTLFFDVLNINQTTIHIAVDGYQPYSLPVKSDR